MHNNRTLIYAIKLLSVIFLLLALTSCASNYNWGWYTVSPFNQKGQSNLSFLLQGLVPTISLSLVAFTLSTIIGLIIAILGKLGYTITVVFSRSWVALFRSVPVLVLLLWVYYGLPIIASIQISIFTASILAMGLCESAFIAEIFRAGIESISKSQIESARVMGANTVQVYGKIILPQVFTRMLPAIINQYIYMIKISSLASIIGFTELTRSANELTVIEYRPLEIYSILIIEYLLLILLVTWLGKLISKKLDPSHDE